MGLNAHLLPVRLAVVGGLDDLVPGTEQLLLDRGPATDPELERAVADLIADVRRRGDAALRDLGRRFDGVALEEIEVPRDEWDRARGALPAAVRDALEQAANAIAVFHRAQLPETLEVEVRAGVRLGRRAEPLRRVGVYAPGGRAAYPSSVLMGVVPARVAGVAEVLVCSPPGPDGRPPAAVVAACAIAGADRLFAVGGAGAVAALACGTDSIPRVQKVVGPGNAYVTEAKRQLNGVVAIDCPAGPSEVLVIADETASAELIAAELVAQAEHDPDAAAVLVTTHAAHVDEVAAALARLLEDQPRREIVETALAARGGILVARGIDAALAFAERYAPEHLLLLTARPRSVLQNVRAAGTVFLGPGSSVTFGDYLTGANHVLPTAGLARAYSGLSTLDFVRWSTYQEVDDDAARELAAPTATLADAEGLPGHALAARLRAPGGARASTPPTTSPITRVPIRFRSAYREIRPYEPGRVPTTVDLSDNTNLFGVPPAASALLESLEGPIVTRYPSVYAVRLKNALARLHGAEPANVTTGCGSDDVIDSAVRAFLEPGETLAYPWPTFGVVPAFARMNAAVPVAVPLLTDFALDAGAMLAERAAVTYICRPNNPTGTAFDRAAVARIVREAAGVVLIDEAYADFADDDVLDIVLASDRALVLRTLSKAYGLAGLRIGYAIGPASLVAEVEKSRGFYKVTGPGEAAAIAVLEQDLAWVRERVQTVRANREKLARALEGLGLRTWPSAANFLLVKVPPSTGGAATLAASLRERDVAVRAFPALPDVGDCIRVTVGPWPMMDTFVRALEAALAGDIRGAERES